MQKPPPRGESDNLYADFPATPEQQIRLSCLAAINVLALPQSRIAQRGRAYVLKRYNVTEEDMERYRTQQ